MLKILNTMSGQKEEFVPREKGKIRMFVCGPTVYDYIHIGNARTFVFFDVVAKYLRHKGYEVDYIQNITDIDDKIIQRAHENSRDPIEWAREYEDKFLKDIEGLGVTGVSRYARATEHIQQVVKQVKTLMDKDNAYLIGNDGWYFDLKTFSEYGKLSKRTAQMADDAVSRIDESDKKRNVGDFALWKLSKPSEPAWDFETGKYLGIVNSADPAFTKASAGRPGWHIEDTAITEHYFGPQYDLHGGGQDLIFPHHEAEITQQESVSGKSPFVKYWMHVAFIVSPAPQQADALSDKNCLLSDEAGKKQKMSKSLGNFAMTHKLLQKYSKEVLRFYLLSGYYRSPLDFSDKTLRQSEAGVNRIYEFIQKLNLADGNGKENTEELIEKIRREFLRAMDDDFNTPQAYGALFDFIRDLNVALTSNSLDKHSIKKTKEFLEEVDAVLGIIPSKQENIPDEISELVEKRENHRKDKNWEEADKIRVRIEEMGYRVEDTAYGPLVFKFS